jgi:ParB family chromosome partitioning protein
VKFSTVCELPLEKLQVGPSQARVRDVEKDLDELVQSIRIHGQLEPIVVAPIVGTDKFEIITGQRRYLAHKRLQAPTILASILNTGVDNVTGKALSISENVVRRDLSPKDLIDACTALYQRYGSVKSVAEEVGLPYQRVLSYVKFDRLRSELKELVTSGAVDLQTALRTEDALADRGDEVDVAAVARSLAGMSRAQQTHYLKNMGRDSAGPAGADAELPEITRIVQILVTLDKALHAELRRWARSQGLVQDEAARQIIERFFHEQALTNGAHPADDVPHDFQR